MVHADELTWPAIRRGLEDPNLSYGTMGQIGIRFVDLEVSRTGIKITLSDATDDLGWSTPGHNPRLFTTYFIGEGGKVLHTTGSLKPNTSSSPATVGTFARGSRPPTASTSHGPSQRSASRQSRLVIAATPTGAAVAGGWLSGSRGQVDRAGR
jgi:hypothetical protein